MSEAVAVRSELHREAMRAAVKRTPSVAATLAHETVVNLIALGGVVYVATVSNVYRVEGDELVRLHWPRGPARRKKEA